MAKVLLISTVIAIVAIPVAASRAKNSTRGLRWTILGILFFNVFYLVAIRYIYPKLLS